MSDTKKRKTIYFSLKEKQEAVEAIDERLLDTFIEMEKDDIPDYTSKDGKILCDGKIANPEELVKDYEKLKTELKRLDELSSRLLNNTKDANQKLVKTVKIEKNKRKKQALVLTLVLGFIALLATGLVYYKKQAEQEAIKAIAEKHRIEKEKVSDMLKSTEQKSKEILDSIEQKHSLEKQSLLLKMQQEKEEKLMELREKMASQRKDLTPEEKKELLSKMEEEIRQKYQQNEAKEIKQLSAQMEEERNKMKEQFEKLANITKKLEDNKEQLDTKKRLEEAEKIKESIQKELEQTKEQLAKTKKEMNTLKENTADRTPTEISVTDSKKIPSIVKQPGTVSNSQEIDLTSQSKAEEFIKSYQQQLPKNISVDADFISNNSRYLVNIMSQDNSPENSLKKLIKIQEPKKYKGHKYLSIIDKKHLTGSAWKYEAEQLHSKKEAVRISDINRKSTLLESEMTYEDWIHEDITSYKYTYLQTEVLRGRNTHIILCEPKTEQEKEASQYSKKYYWIDAEFNIPLQIKYFGKDNKLSKIFLVKKMLKIEDQYWMPSIAVMLNVKNNNKTTISFDNWRVPKEIPQELFSPRSLNE